MNRLIKTALIVVVVNLALVVVLGLPANSGPLIHRDQSWNEPNFSPCENVGVHGTFRTHARIGFRDGEGSDREILQVSVYVTSAAEQLGNFYLATTLEVVHEGQVVRSLQLSRPRSATFEPEPNPYESDRLYLPEATTVPLPENASLRFVVSPIVKLAGGHCALGTSTHVWDPLD